MSINSCDGDYCDCACHDDQETDEIVMVCGSIDKYFQPATNKMQYSNEHANVLANGLKKLEDAIDGERDDPGKLYPLHERVRRVIGALQGKIGVLESRGRR